MIPWYTVMVMTLFLLTLLIYGQHLQSKTQQDTVVKLKKHCAIMFRLGGILSLSEGTSFYDFRTQVMIMDTEIRTLTEKTPKLKNFIYLHGGLPVSQLHITRSFCRQLELTMWNFKLSTDDVAGVISDNMIAYVNRLSLYLYHLTRYYNYSLHYGDDPIKF
jgi:cob(I)alamin adenosyltransferase